MNEYIEHRQNTFTGRWKWTYYGASGKSEARSTPSTKTKQGSEAAASRIFGPSYSFIDVRTINRFGKITERKAAR